jgi:hypothetical protein
MYTDARTIFSDAQSLSGSDETVVSTAVDLGVVPTLRSLGFQQCFVNISTVAPDSASSGGTVEVQIVSDSTDAFSSPTVHWSSGALDEGSTPLNAGDLIDCVPLPLGARYQRYLGVRYIIVGQIDALQINANITPYPVVQNHYPDAI